MQQSVNPYLPAYEYIPDGEPYVFDDRLYIFGSHDQFGSDAFCVGNYMGWSAPVEDLAAWQCSGVIYDKTQDPLYQDGNRMYAPDVQRGPDGRYYLYYSFDFTGILSVAVSGAPGGPYAFYGHVHYPDGTLLGRKPEDAFHYDPGVLADEDERVYLYTGFCLEPSSPLFQIFPTLKPNLQGCMVTELEPDMLTVKALPRVIVPCSAAAAGTGFEGHSFFEAPSMRKVNGRYCFIYSSEQGHELCYAVSDRPDGGFAYGGILISNGDIGYQGNSQPLNYTGTNHGSIVQIGSDWYVFYHRQTGGTPYNRQGCAEKITILPDGRIPQVRLTSQGLNGKPLAGSGSYNAGIACCLMSADGAAPYLPYVPLGQQHPYITQDGPDREHTPGQYIANLRSGALVGYRSFMLAQPATLRLTMRGSGEGRFIVCTAKDGPALCIVPVLPGADWHTAHSTAPLPAGEQELWLRYEGSGTVELQELCFGA